MKSITRWLLCFLISFTLIQLPIVKSAHAGMIRTSQAVDKLDRSTQEARVLKLLERQDVQTQLTALGVSKVEAEKRLASLSDSEVKKLAQDIDTATIGGDVGGILIIVLLVILIIYFAKRI